MNTKVWIFIGTEGRNGDGGAFSGIREEIGGRGGGEERDRREEAVRRGPIVFVVRWWLKDWNVLGIYY